MLYGHFARLNLVDFVFSRLFILLIVVLLTDADAAFCDVEHISLRLLQRVSIMLANAVFQRNILHGLVVTIVLYLYFNISNIARIVKWIFVVRLHISIQKFNLNF